MLWLTISWGIVIGSTFALMVFVSGGTPSTMFIVGAAGFSGFLLGSIKWG
jgi:hypothetical protein